MQQKTVDLSDRQLQQGSQKTLKDSETCRICGGLQWILSMDDKGREFAAPCECRNKAIASTRRGIMDIPEAFSEMELKSFSTTVYRESVSRNKISLACKAVKEYLANFEGYAEKGMGLYLCSYTKGSGKTRMTAGIANELVKKYRVKFTTSTTILNEIKRTWGKGSENTTSNLLDTLSRSEVLIIDDFGTENVSNWTDDIFYHIINERYVHKRVTLYTSNESLKSLKYDDRITNRIKERTLQIAFPEESVREYIAQENDKEMLNRIS